MSAKLDGDRLRFELARRGRNQADLAESAGVTPETLSRAMGGRSVRAGTLSRVASALLEMPVLRGADLLLQEFEKKAAGASTSPATSEEAGRASGATSRP